MLFVSTAVWKTSCPCFWGKERVLVLLWQSIVKHCKQSIALFMQLLIFFKTVCPFSGAIEERFRKWFINPDSFDLGVCSLCGNLLLLLVRYTWHPFCKAEYRVQVAEFDLCCACFVWFGRFGVLRAFFAADSALVMLPPVFLKWTCSCESR